MTWIKIQKMLGFGFKIVSDLIDADITTPDALYTTSVKQLGEAVGSDKIAAKLKAEIEKSREMTLDKFLAGLNIPHLGKTNSKRLTKRFGTLDAVLKATADDFATVEGIKTTAKKIRSGLTGKDEQMKKLLEHVTIVEVAGKLAGKSFAMTGLRNINGHDIGDLITQNGGDTKSGVSKGLDYLIIKDPESTSNKAEKARKYGTKLISPAEFMEMIS
jgi:DNA ligase (NAD+)